MKRVPPKTGSPRASPRARLDAGVNPLRVSAGLIFFWLPLCLLGARLYFGLLQVFSGSLEQLTEGSNGLVTYREAEEAIFVGKVPYRDFFIEYPPGSLPAFVLPALFTTGWEDHAAFFASEMAVVLVAALVLTAYREDQNH